MILPAAVLLLQAAATGSGGAVAFDLGMVRVASDSFDETSLLSSNDAATSECWPASTDEVVICGRRWAPSLRVEPSSSDRPADHAPSGAGLVDRSGCGVRQAVTGCFQGVPVLRATVGGDVTLLPTVTNPDVLPEEDRPRR